MVTARTRRVASWPYLDWALILVFIVAFTIFVTEGVIGGVELFGPDGHFYDCGTVLAPERVVPDLSVQCASALSFPAAATLASAIVGVLCIAGLVTKAVIFRRRGVRFT